MNNDLLMAALTQAKQMSSLLDETLRLTRALTDAAERKDQISMKLILAERGEILEKLQHSDRLVKELPESVSEPEDRERMAELLRGVGAIGTAEGAVAERMLANRRLYQQIMDLDRKLNSLIMRA